MHELALCRSVVATVAPHADGRPVSRVHLRIGHLRQVVPGALDLAWRAVTEGTDLDGAVLDVEDVPAVVRCRRCAAETRLEWPVLVCGACEGRDVELVSGEELLVTAIDVRSVA